MKRMIDDGMLDTAAKSFIKHYEGANAPADAPSSENSYFTSIKVAKAKAGARRSINRTIRICAVAAVMMIGLVCALFMGAENDDKEPEPVILNCTMDGYMWKNNDADSNENMQVRVRFDLEQTQVIYSENKDNIPSKPADGTRLGAIIEGKIVIEDTNGNAIKVYEDLRFTKDEYSKNYDAILPISFSHQEKEYTKEDGMKTHWVMGISFNEDYTDFEFFIDDTFEPNLEYLGLEVHITEDGSIWTHRDAIFITCGATTREEAVAKRYEIAEAYYKNEIKEKGYSHFNYDRIKNHAWN